MLPPKMICIEKLKKRLQNRSGRVLFNIVCSTFAKGGALFVSFFLVPMTIDYLTPAEYGVWMTLSSIVAWVTYFDIGLGNGLRNKLTEALSVPDLKLAQGYVSTCFLVLLLICACFVAGLRAANHFLSWNRILNIADGVIPDCNQFSFLIFTCFTLTFVLRMTGVVFVAYQYPMLNDIIQLCINILIASGIIVLKYVQPHGSIKGVGYVYILIPFIIWLLIYPMAFYGKFRAVRPIFRCFNKQYLSSLMVLGGKFFILQLLMCLAFFASVNVIIAHLCGSEAVTQYNIAFKYFNLNCFAFGIIYYPYWNAITEAYTKKDFHWIRTQMKFLCCIWGGFVFLALLMLLISPSFFRMWVGTKIQIPFSVSAAMAFYTIIYNGFGVFCTFCNGISKITIQLLGAILGVALLIPCCFFFRHLFGLAGIVWGTTLSLSCILILLMIQYHKITNHKAAGIWNK